jgi:hypothetical protein
MLSRVMPTAKGPRIGHERAVDLMTTTKGPRAYKTCRAFSNDRIVDRISDCYSTSFIACSVLSVRAQCAHENSFV